MDQKNSPEAYCAMYLNQAEGLLFDLQRIPLMPPKPAREPYSQHEYTSAAADDVSEAKAVRRWIGALRARWGHPRAA